MKGIYASLGPQQVSLLAFDSLAISFVLAHISFSNFVLSRIIKQTRFLIHINRNQPFTNPNASNQTTKNFSHHPQTNLIMKLGKEISHSTHPQHKLKMEYTETPFSCDGCKEAGIGIRYRCEACDFDLHKICALAPAIISHPFYPRCEFRLYSRPPGQLARACDACRRIVRGLVYHCTRCGFDLHPCCANLPKCLDDGERNFYLCAKISSSCHCCGSKGLGWSYQSECKKYSLHVSCVKELLVESWHVMYLNIDKNRMRQTQMRIPGIRGATRGHHHKGRMGRVEKCCQVAGNAARVIISAILGDPTSIIAAVIGGFLLK